MKTQSPVNTSFQSSLWLPALFVAGALLLAGCGATAPVVQSVDGPDTLETGESGTFEASINEDADEPLTYTWQFGDGETASGLLVNHSYSSAGEYTVQFRASNEGGADSSTTEVTVVEPPQPAQITSINANPNPADVGETVNFQSNVQGDAPLSYEWDFGDGESADGSSPSHTYEEAGQYTVQLQASNEAGQDSRTLTMQVEEPLPEICTTVSEFNSAFFGRNSSTLTDEARQDLTENADILSQCPNLSVRIEGFAAPGERNPQSLSEDRAEAVADFYEDNDVEGDRITTSGEGRVSGVTSKKDGTRQYRRADSIPERQEDGM